MSKDRSAEREMRKLQTQNTALKKQVSRLRKKLGRFAPVEESPESELSAKEAQKQEPDGDTCPECGGGLALLTTPGGTKVVFCKNKCGFRRKQS